MIDTLTAYVIRALDGRDTEFDVAGIVDTIKTDHDTLNGDNVPHAAFWAIVDRHAHPAPPYVQSVELRYNGLTALFHCAHGDQFYANLDGGKWWLEFIPGDPTEGPFDDLTAVRAWLNGRE